MDEVCGCGGEHVVGRACTPERKRDVLERVLAAWLQHLGERLGQLLANADRDALYTATLFTIEDDALAAAVERRRGVR